MDLPSRKEYELLSQLGSGDATGRTLEMTTRVARGTLYVTLCRLKGMGWIESEPGTTGTGRFTTYRITDFGRKALQNYRDDMIRLLKL